MQSCLKLQASKRPPLSKVLWELNNLLIHPSKQNTSHELNTQLTKLDEIFPIDKNQNKKESLKNFIEEQIIEKLQSSTVYHSDNLSDCSSPCEFQDSISIKVHAILYQYFFTTISHY